MSTDRWMTTILVTRDRAERREVVPGNSVIVPRTIMASVAGQTDVGKCGEVVAADAWIQPVN